MPLLRGHHLVCLHFFDGEGYDEDFINNLKKILRRAEEEETTVSFGADDVCKSCPCLKESRCRDEENSEEDIRDMDAKALTLLSLSIGDKVKLGEMREGVYKIFPEWFSLYCKECDWRNACKKNASFQILRKNV